jgi:hypothetical protein
MYPKGLRAFRGRRLPVPATGQYARVPDGAAGNPKTLPEAMSAGSSIWIVRNSLGFDVCDPPPIDSHNPHDI